MHSRSGLGLAFGLVGYLALTPSLRGQVVERDTKLTGPKGRTIERSIRTERGPGFVDRQIEIKRPGETLIRETRVQAPGGYYGPRPGYRPGPPGRPPIIERDVIVERAPILAPFVAPFLSFSFGSPPLPPPPPPVVVVPEPVYIPEPVYLGAPPMVVAPPVYAPVPAQPPLVVNEPPLSPQVADALGRLASFHHQSRRDGCLTLGNLGDPRAVGPLMERVQHDLDREVRTAAAWALGELGDPRSAVVLERAALYDKRQEVREAANSAYNRLPRSNQPVAAGSKSPAPVIVSQPGSTTVNRPTAVPMTNPAIVNDPGPAPMSDTPPPFPIPDSNPDLPR